MCYSGKCPQEDFNGECTGLINNMCYYDYERQKREDIAKNKLNGKFMNIIIDEGNKKTSIAVRNKEECISEILSEYCKSEVIIGEMLENVKLEGFSVIDTIYIYSKVINEIEGDFLLKLVNIDEVNEITSSFTNQGIDFSVIGFEDRFNKEKDIKELEETIIAEPSEEFLL